MDRLMARNRIRDRVLANLQSQPLSSLACLIVF
jgi:hypothetical protein